MPLKCGHPLQSGQPFFHVLIHTHTHTHTKVCDAFQTHKVLISESPVAVCMLLLCVASKFTDRDTVTFDLRNSRSIYVIILGSNKQAHLIGGREGVGKKLNYH